MFYRQIANLVIDTTNVNRNVSVAAIRWPTAQATSLQNIQFKLSAATGTRHVGVSIEAGSGGFMNDLTFEGGLNGLNVSNQQFTMRNLTFSNAVTAINQLSDWGWTYKGLNINNCGVGYVKYRSKKLSSNLTMLASICLPPRTVHSKLAAWSSLTANSPTLLSALQWAVGVFQTLQLATPSS